MLPTAGPVNVASNVVGGYTESTFHWHHLPDTAFPNYSHFSNVNWWNQFYYQQATYDVYTNHIPRPAAAAPDSSFDESNVSSYELEIGSPVSTSNPPSAPCVQPPLITPQEFPNESIPFPFASYQQFTQPANAYSLPHQQLPIRPVPQQAGGGESIHRCNACLRFCASAGGLKRHAKFCRASQTNLTNIFASLKRKESKGAKASEPSTNPVSNASQTQVRNVNEAITQRTYEITPPINLSSSGNTLYGS